MRKLILLVALVSVLKADVYGQNMDSLQVIFDSLYLKGSDPELTITLGKKLVAHAEKNQSPDSAIYGRNLIRVATYMFPAGQKDSAEIFALRAVLVLPLNGDNQINALGTLGNLWMEQADYGRADSILTIAVHRRAQFFGKNNNRYFNILYVLALTKELQDKYLEAENLFTEGIELWQKYAREERPLLGQFYSKLGYIKLFFGQTEQSEKLLRRALQVNGAGNSGGRLPYTPYFQLIQFLHNQGRLNEAMFLLDKISDDMTAHSEQKTNNFAFLLHMRGLIQVQLNLIDDAIDSYEKAITISRQNHITKQPATIELGLDMAEVLIEKGDLPKATQVLSDSRDSIMLFGYEKTVMNTHLLELSGKCANASGDFKAAIQFYQQALSLGTEIFGKEDSLNVNRTYYQIVLAEAFLRYGKVEDALNILLPISVSLDHQNLKSAPRRAVLRTLVLAHIADNQPAMAAENLRQLNEMLIQSFTSDIFLLTDQQRLGYITETNDQSNILLSFLSGEGARLPNTVSIALDFQLFTKSILLSTAQKIKENINADTSLTAVFSDWTDTRERLAWCYTQPKTDLAAQQINVPVLEAHADSLEKSIALRRTDFASASLQKPFSWTNVRDHLRPGEAALEIARFRQHHVTATDTVRYAIFVITPDMHDQPAVVFIPDGKRLEQILTEKYLAECAERDGNGQTQELFETIWQPLEPYLKAVTRVFVSADGVFHKINLGALRLANRRYLVDQVDIHPVFSLRDVVAPVTHAAAGERTAFLAGNPAFSTSGSIVSRSRSVTETDSLPTVLATNPMPYLVDDLSALRGGLHLDPLPGSQQEVENIAALLQKKGWKTSLSTGEKATESAVKAARKPTILHLATHGYFLANEKSGTAGLSRGVVERNPMLRSMLFFAGAQNTLDKKSTAKNNGDDGVLTAFEAQNLDLEGTELVVLSACQTAQGKLQNGEGVYGLQRALRIAGAQNIILSLWDVDDTVGRTFMLVFYKKWLGGMDKAAAFRAAQLAIKAEHPQPFYWAGFVLVGG